jgi:hypothetical protein
MTIKTDGHGAFWPKLGGYWAEINDIVERRKSIEADTEAAPTH